MALAGSLAEGIGGAILAQRTGMSAGTAHAIGTGGDLGLLTGLGLGALLQVEGGSPELFTAGLVGAAGGMTGGALAAGRRGYTWGDVEVLRESTLLGVATAGLGLVWVDGGSDEAIIGTLLAGEVAGLLVGDRVVSGRDFTASQALVIDLGTMAGALTGLGVALIAVRSDSDTAGRIAATAAVGGAIGGFALTVGAFRSQAIPGVRDATSGARLQVVPRVGPGGEKGVAVAGAF